MNKEGILLALCILGIILISLYPITSLSTKSITLLLFFITFCVTEKMLLRNRKVLILINSAFILFLLFLVLPGSSPDAEIVRDGFVDALRRYEGVSYVWGGENEFGIDCSGLMRKSMMMTLLKVGISSVNPKPIRQAALMWAYDCSARGFRDGYRGLTSKVMDADSVNSLRHDMIQPGDMVVTRDGVHIMGYLGNTEWMEADPEEQKVIRVKVPTENNWFGVPVTIVRWNISDTFNDSNFRPLTLQEMAQTEVIYESCSLSTYFDFEKFKKIMEGYHHFWKRKPEMITLIDFSKSSTEKRFFVINLEEPKLLYHTYVAHGEGSGDEYATEFSNTVDSHQSSLGFFLTSETYNGKHGYSLRLDGLVSGINDNARKRAIVIHSANYVGEKWIKEHGMCGRSWGCPALPEDVSEEIIDTIKGGSLMYAFR